MAINDCPHCGKPAIGFWSKSILGPAMSRKCASCGEPISVSWGSMWTNLPILAVVVLAGTGGASQAAFWTGLAAALAASMALQWYYAPLVKR